MQLVYSMVVYRCGPLPVSFCCPEFHELFQIPKHGSFFLQSSFSAMNRLSIRSSRKSILCHCQPFLGPAAQTVTLSSALLSLSTLHYCCSSLLHFQYPWVLANLSLKLSVVGVASSSVVSQPVSSPNISTHLHICL